MLNSLRTKNINCEDEAKFIQDRILSAERNLGEFCNTFAQYARKIAKVRDRGDAISEAAVTYAESEDINKSLKLGLTNFANVYRTISDYSDIRAQYINNKVVNEFSLYETICKQAKDEVKQIFNARDKELTRKKQLNRVRERNPHNRQLIMQAETELVKATTDVSRTVYNLEEKITMFERQKLHDIKTILHDFITVEIAFHAKSLEQLTKAYQDINAIDEEADLQAFREVRESKEVEFKKTLKISDDVSSAKSKSMHSPFRASRSLGSINTILSKTIKKRSPGIPSEMQRKSRLTAAKSEETLDSIKNDLTDTNESESEQENSSENTEKSSSIINQKYLK